MILVLNNNTSRNINKLMLIQLAATNVDPKWPERMIPSGQKEWSLRDKRMIPSGHKEWSLGDIKNDPKGNKRMIPLHVVLITCSNNQTEVTTIEMWHCPRMESRIPWEMPLSKKTQNGGTSKLWDALGLKKRSALGFYMTQAKDKGKDFFTCLK